MHKGYSKLQVIALLFTMSACQQDFDAQYAQTEEKVKAAEAKIDAEMAKEAKREPGAAIN